MSKTKVPFIADMMNRRVPQFIGIYLAISWGVIQFITWLVDRYLLSPYLVDLSFAILVSMLPSILVLSYFHGRPGKDKWTKVEKIVVPINFIITIVSMFIVFYPKDLGAITKDVILTDQDGNTYYKTTVKSEFRKKYAIFLFENTSGDSSYDWLSYGLGMLLNHDFYQDLYLSNRGSEASNIKAELGYSNDEILSFSAMQSISERVLSDYFVTGDFNIENDKYVVNFKVYKTSNAKIVSNLVFENNDLFSLIDEASIQLKLDIGVPQSYLDEFKDLPVSELTTSSIEALRSYSYSEFASDHVERFSHVEDAVRFDPKSAYLNYILALGCKFSNDIDNYNKHIDIAAKYGNQLSEKFKFALQIQIAQKDGFGIEKRNSILNMWIDLYPDDPSPYIQLSELSAINGQMEETIFYYNKILEIMPNAHEYIIKTGDLYYEAFDFENAEKYYLKYKKLYPKYPDSYFNIGRCSLAKKEYKDALEYFEQSKFLGKTGSEIDIFIADVLSILEKWTPDKYAEYLTDKINQYKNETWFNEGASAIYETITGKYRTHGEYKKAIPYIDKLLESVLKNQGEAFYYLLHGHYLDCYAPLGRAEDADKLIVEVGDKLKKTPPFNVFFPTFVVAYYSEIEEWERMNNLIESISPYILSMGVVFFESMISESKGDYYQAVGEYDKAIIEYNKSIDLLTTTYTQTIHLNLGKVYRKMGDFKNAEKSFSEAFADPDLIAELYYEYALLKEEIGELSQAREYIQEAYSLYKNADEEVELANKIWDKHKQLTTRQ